MSGTVTTCGGCGFRCWYDECSDDFCPECCEPIRWGCADVCINCRETDCDCEYACD